jgi:hypothetical protein
LVLLNSTPSKDEKFGFASATVKDASRPIPEKAVTPIDVTLAGIATDVGPLATKNASFAMDVTPSGMTTDPTHKVCPVTTFVSIVKVPDGPQLTVVTEACTGDGGKPVEIVAATIATLKDFSKAILPFERCIGRSCDKTAFLENFMSLR